MAIAGIGDNLGYEQIAVDTAQGLTLPTIPCVVNMCIITPEGGNVRWLDNGTNPTVSSGNLLALGSSLTYDANNYRDLKLIGQTLGVKVNVNYYGKKL